jgi:hypothetical protein
MIDLEVLKAILVLLAVIFVFIFIEVFALMIGIGAVKGENTSFGNVFLTELIIVFIMGLITFVFQMVMPAYVWAGGIAGLIIGMFIIQARHNTTFLGALGAIFIYAVFIVILYVLLVFVFTSINAILTDLTGFDLKNWLPFEIST